MRSIVRFALTALVAAVAALAILTIPILFRGDATTAPRPTPRPGLLVVAEQIRTAPDVSAPTRAAVTAQLGKALKSLYAKGFVQPLTTPGPDESPRPAPAKRVAPSLTSIARAGLARSPQVFNEAGDLSVYSGTIVFEGFITFDGKRPIEAMLDVDFSGEAAPVGPRSPLVKLRQTGTVVLKNTSGGWLVDGFDLRLATRPLPSPTPPPS